MIRFRLQDLGQGGDHRSHFGEGHTQIDIGGGQANEERFIIQAGDNDIAIVALNKGLFEATAFELVNATFAQTKDCG